MTLVCLTTKRKNARRTSKAATVPPCFVFGAVSGLLLECWLDLLTAYVSMLQIMTLACLTIYKIP
ncbi:hypothetical protein GSU0209 [Geobacter sulfurreducens PCA]|uniref:Uncharacterized protein n=1 Tax=Geobacter sulfurreducens (strain ATCC 51573 / DSM 12127 / PCA) TaxID=243231 RepID=Q74GN7_GEOSL|nr:hypothetical protein GSU0209 [Geobacter sulfurreducens PCA]HBB68824.1 hypothetical protein [Geobacter sulfurreducens]HCD96942.1 hypothetical protein [Geobacter sulfurreducens]